jgi:hypothetical protein
MAIRVVPKWAKWAIMVGIFAPILGAFGMTSYNANFSFMTNAQTQHVDLPFFRGQNPVVCMNESIRMIASVVVVETVHRSVVCAKPTRVAYRHIFILSMVLLLLGLYRVFNPEALADKWPTEWRGGGNVPDRALQGKPKKIQPDDEVPDQTEKESGG